MDDPFDDDHGFLRYVELHAQTNSALFSAPHLRRLFALADREFPEPRLPATAFRALHSDPADELVSQARKRISCPRYSICMGGQARSERSAR